MTSYVDNNEDIPVLPSELKPVILDRLQKEITSKIGGSICHKRRSSRDTSKRIGGKKRARESKEDCDEPSQEKEVKSQVDGQVNVSMSISESAVRSRLVVGKSYCSAFHWIYLQSFHSYYFILYTSYVYIRYRDKPMYKSTRESIQTTMSMQKE